MAQAIRNDAIVPGEQRGNQRLVGGKPGNKQQRARISQPVRQALFQFTMRLAVTADVAGAAGTHAITRRPLLPGGDNLRMLAQSEIIIAGEIQPAPIFTDKPTPGTMRHRLAAPECIRLPPLAQRLVDALLPAHSTAAL